MRTPRDNNPVASTRPLPKSSKFTDGLKHVEYQVKIDCWKNCLTGENKKHAEVGADLLLQFVVDRHSRTFLITGIHLFQFEEFRVSIFSEQVVYHFKVGSRKYSSLGIEFVL